MFSCIFQIPLREKIFKNIIIAYAFKKNNSLLYFKLLHIVEEEEEK